MESDPLGSIDGETIRETLADLVDTISAAALLIIVEIFKVFLTYIQALIDGYFIANPAIILISLMIIFTAYMIWRR